MKRPSQVSGIDREHSRPGQDHGAYAHVGANPGREVAQGIHPERRVEQGNKE
ncbi:MAG TPA: hypothetical protein VMG82_19765 [Candidatus Sulfotelmatobacter sp.]|nr:hypothetical protein [Candidatus Sulfotelmatobacter sp.]